MTKPRVGINGFGRIGRMALRAWLEQKQNIEIVAINDVVEPVTLAHLFKYDSTYGKFSGNLNLNGTTLNVNGKEIALLKNRELKQIPWKEHKVDYVLECTGLFTEAEKCKEHFSSETVKRIIISAPAKNEDITLVLGVNEDKYDPKKHKIISNASCTTNCLAPVAKVLHQNFNIKRGLMTTVHAYTMDQRLLDAPHKDLRRARASSSLIPTTTGAAKALGLVIPDLKGKFDGIAIRVPTETVSLVDFVVEVQKATTKDEVNKALRTAAESSLKGILEVCSEPLVSIDFKGNPASAIVDELSTMVIENNFIKVMAWYDNEYGYACRLIDLTAFLGAKES